MSPSPSTHRAGFVNLIGLPNAGKSTLLNHLVGVPLAAVNSKAQTTRQRLLGIWNEEGYQVVFSDTPGFLSPAYPLQEAMMREVAGAFEDADILLWVVDAQQATPPEQLLQLVQRQNKPLLVVLNKVDLLTPEVVKERMAAWQERLPHAHMLPMAALHQVGITGVMEYIKVHLPIHPPYFPEDTLTDRPERFFAAELIRAQILAHYQQEVPYSVAVVVDYFKQAENLLRMHSIIYVERESQKAILIGKGGAALKRMSTAARKDLEQFFHTKVFLEQRIKVLPDWRKKKHLLRRLGYAVPKE